MDCHAFDWRGYGLGELPPAEMAECERHLGSCAQCRTELSRWQATLSAVRNLPQVEPPRRIVFVSDPILPEPWSPGPAPGHNGSRAAAGDRGPDSHRGATGS